jgi:hypothetical protein
VWELTEAGTKQAKVAAELNIPPGTVGTIRSRVRNRIRRAWQTPPLE